MFYNFVKFVFKLYFSLFNKVSVQGSENIPESGGLILCPNHIHWLDPLLIGSYVKRDVYFMAKVELFKNNFFAIILKGIHAFPVKRGKGDISAIKYSFKVIRNGNVLGLFPEGTRSKNGRLLPAEPGVALIAIKTGALILPVRITGSYKAFSKIHITIGKPISYSGYSDKKLSMEEIDELSQNIMKELAKLE